jgi:GT2 family glycosyltransferase
MSHVAITIVTWNSMKYLPEALASIAGQTYRDRTLLIVDNASTDGVAEFVRANYPDAVIIRNAKNLGFARGHNQAIAYAKAHLRPADGELFVMVTNPDVVLEPDYLETLMDQMTRRTEAGSAAGKLRKLYAGAEEGDDAVRSDVLDSTGMRVYRSRRVVERGAGEKDDGVAYARTEEVFGVSGALALYRLRALEDVAEQATPASPPQYFDEDFFVYKEDVDLAWRLRLRGWTALFMPRALAFHHRTAAGAEKASLGERLKGRRTRSKAVNFHSARNHLLMLAKDDHAANAVLDAPRVLWYETGKFLYFRFLDPSTLRAYGSYLRLLPKMWAKRGRAMKRAKVSAREMRKWFA